MSAPPSAASKVSPFGFVPEGYLLVKRESVDTKVLALDESKEFLEASKPHQATAAEKAQLTYVPAGMHENTNRVVKPSRKVRKSLKANWAKDGQAISRSFDPVGKIPRVIHTSLEQQITLQFSTSFSSLTTSTTVPTFFGIVFTLNTLDGYTEFTSAFDQYRIKEVEFAMAPNGTLDGITGGSMRSCVDLDDANTPTSFAQIDAHQGSLLTPMFTGHYHRFVPHFAVAAYSGVFTSFSNAVGWVDCASPGVQHYGVKVGLSPTSSAVSYLVDVRCTVSFRAPGI